MRSAILIIGLTMLSTAYGQSPPSLPSFPAPPSNVGTPPPLELTITPSKAPSTSTPPLMQTSSYANPIKAGDRVQLLRGSYIYSGPSEQSYRCGTLEGGNSVILIDLPSPGSEFTPIVAPENCYSLIPISAIHHSWAFWVDLKSLMKTPQKTIKPIETLIYGEAPNGEYLESNNTLPKGSIIRIMNETKIKVKGKEEIYCVISSAGKEKRFVRTADLEGVAAAAQAAQAAASPQNSTPLYGNNRAQQQHWQDNSPLQQAVLESEQLPPVLANQVQQAEQAYRTAMHYGAWEDARQRYQHLLESEVLSVRILAKNRLEFISDWQRNPPVVTTAMTPQQGTGLSPALNREPWIPGGMAAARPAPPTTPTTNPAPVKDLVIRPNQPGAPTSNPSIVVPTYPGPGAATPQQQPVKQQPPVAPPAQTTIQPQGQPVSRPATTATPPPAATAPQRVKMVGKLNRAVQYSGPNQLYYLTNSQGYLTYYARGVSSAGVRLDAYLNRNIEVEGEVVQAMIDGQKKQQINVVGVKLLQ